MKTYLIILFAFFSFNFVFAQHNNQEIIKIIIEKDSLFWTGYNTCDTTLAGKFVADEVEFYHDKGGITLGKTALLTSIKKNLCSNSNFRTTRVAVAGTVHVYPLYNGGIAYGAIISGEHFFDNTYDGKPVRREGIARFSQLWILKSKVWKMTRILSFDHREVKN